MQEIKTWQDRLREKFPETADQNLFTVGHLEHAMEAEIADLRAALAAPQAADTGKVREAVEAMNRAKLLPIWDNDVPHKLHVELDVIFKALSSMAAQAPVREVPGGWKLVPVEPTDAMLEAIEDAAKAECSIEWDSQLGGNLHFGDPSRVYADMLAAAPLPAAPVQQEGV